MAQSLRAHHLSPSSVATASSSSLASLLLPAARPSHSSPRAQLAAAVSAQHALRSRGRAGVRRASKASAGKGADGPVVLEKPLKFNPPSHGSRLPSKQHLPKHYGPALSEGERAAQGRKDYPGMMAPEGSWAHWFWHSRAIHVWITMGTLTVLALTTFILNFTQTSPFRHLLPPASELWTEPSHFFTAWMRVLQLHERDRNERVSEKRRQNVEDVTKRRQYQKVHGLDKQNVIANLFKSTAELEEGAKAEGPVAVTDSTVVEASTVPAGPADAAAAEEALQEVKRKRWLGIF